MEQETLREPMLEVEHLSKHFKMSGKSILKAVDDVSLTIYKGETLGLVGESGCGKTTFGRTVIQLYRPTSGSIRFDGRELGTLKRKELVSFKKDAQIIFQDPYASLDPRMTIGDIVGESIDIHKLCSSKQERHDRIISLLERVGLNSEHANRYPHEFSGGQRQRIGIARALAVNPEFIVCDEPVSALDVSIQAQVLNLLKNIQEKMGLTYIFITHDLSVVNHFSDDIAVMYLGKLIEKAPAEELFAHPTHPYTQALLSAIPVPDIHHKQERIILKGEISSPINPKPGCRFAPRCIYATEECFKNEPELINMGEEHFVSCLKWKEMAEKQQ